MPNFCCKMNTAIKIKDFFIEAEAGVSPETEAGVSPETGGSFIDCFTSDKCALSNNIAHILNYLYICVKIKSAIII